MADQLIARLARWVSELKIDDIPPDVIELCREQTASVLAAGFGADRLPAAARFRGALTSLSPGAVRAAPFCDRADAAVACGVTAGLSVALDFDDYLFLGHTGHSAVSVPLALGAHLGASEAEATVAQAAANEVAGRLGAAVVLGPHNGQLWVFIHAAAAALAAARLLSLDQAQTAHALALALAAPPYPSFGSIMGPDSKLWLAGEATSSGVRAAHLARAGLTGPLDALDDPKGFFAGFAFAPSPFFLEGLGKSWVTHTLAIKPYPGCAYVDAVVDSLLEIMAAFRHERGRAMRPDDVARLDVDGSVLTVQMEVLGKAYAPADGLPPTFNLNFRVPHTAAIAIVAGELTSAQFAPEFLQQHSSEILGLAAKTTVRHDWNMSLAVIRAFTAGLAPFRPLARLSWREVRGALRDAQRRISHRLPFGLMDLPAAFRAMTAEDLRRVRLDLGRSEASMDEVDFRNLRLPFAARVRLSTADGKAYEAAREFPDGAPGGKRRPGAARDKFLQEATPHLGREQAEAALARVTQGRPPQEIMDALLQNPGF